MSLRQRSDDQFRYCWHGDRLNDNELVRRCLDGDADAQNQLFCYFHSNVYGMCNGLLRHRNDAEEGVQEAFLVVFNRLQLWEGSRPLKPWIMGVTFHCCLKILSKRAKRPPHVDILPHDITSRPADDYNELVSEINLAVAGLRPNYRTAYELFHEQGQSYADCARILNRSVTDVRNWLARARKKMHATLFERGMVGAYEDKA